MFISIYLGLGGIGKSISLRRVFCLPPQKNKNMDIFAISPSFPSPFEYLMRGGGDSFALPPQYAPGIHYVFLVFINIYGAMALDPKPNLLNAYNIFCDLY